MRVFGLATRWLATMFCFVVFGGGALLFGFVLVPLAGVTSRSPGERARRLRGWLTMAFRAFVRMMARLGGASFEVVGRVPDKGNFVIVANHPTLFDAVVLLALFPQADCIIKHELLRNPFTRLALSGLDFISNADTAEMLDSAVDRLRRGRSLLVFPEGTRSAPGEPVRFAWPRPPWPCAPACDACRWWCAAILRPPPRRAAGTRLRRSGRTTWWRSSRPWTSGPSLASCRHAMPSAP